jgi:MurNAc alpha-1-phosphate uridylyltransferase
MDVLLLLQPVDQMELTHGVGDYDIDASGHIIRTSDKSGSHMFTGIRIVHPRIFDNTPEGAFSFLQCMDKAQQQSKLHGISYDGQWHHISTPEDLQSVNEILKNEKNTQTQKSIERKTA